MSWRVAALLFLSLTTGLRAGAATFSFPALNRSWVNLFAEMLPYREGFVRLELRSPRNRLVIRENRLHLAPSDRGGWEGRFEVDLSGGGDFEVDVTLGEAPPSRLSDKVVMPAQWLTVEGRVSIAVVDGGLEVTILELPSEVQIEIASQLGRQLIGLCEAMTLFLGLNCAGVERSLSVVSVTLPEAGQRYFVPAELLGVEETEALVLWLEEPQASPPG